MKLFEQYKGLKREIYIFFVGKLVTAMGSFVWPMLTFFLTTKLGITDYLTSFIIASMSLLALPAAILGGKLADKYDRKKIIVIFDLISVSLFIVSAILPFGYHTAALLFTSGLFQTIEGPAYDALIADFSTTDDREKAYSLDYLGYNLGFIVGASVSGVLFENYTKLAFLLNGVAILISTILIIIFVNMKNAVIQEETNEVANSIYEEPVDEKISIFKVLRERGVLIFATLLMIFTWMPENISGILLPLKLKTAEGEAGATLYGYLSSFNGLIVILFTPLFTYLLSKVKEIPKIAIGSFLSALGLVFYMLTNNAILLFVGMFFITVGEVTNVLGSNPYHSKRIPLSHRGRIGGVLSLVHGIFSALIQYLIGVLLLVSSNNYSLIFLIFVIVGVLVSILCIFAHKKDKDTFPLLYVKEIVYKN